MTTKLNVSVRLDGPSTKSRESIIVAVSGELDIATAPQFREHFAQLLGPGRSRIVIDVSGLTFIDVVGLRAFTTLRARAERQAISVRLSGVPPQMRRLMGVIGPARDCPSSHRRAKPTMPAGKTGQSTQAGTDR